MEGRKEYSTGGDLIYEAKSYQKRELYQDKSNFRKMYEGYCISYIALFCILLL